MTKLIYQKAMFGRASERAFPWGDMLEECARKLGNRRDLDKTQWYKELQGIIYSQSPEAYDMMNAIIMKQEIDFAIKIFAKFFTLPNMPAPDTLPRAMRDVRKRLVDSGKIALRPAPDGGDTFSSLLQTAEESSGEYNSGIEVRFGQRLKQRFGMYSWEENKLIALEEIQICPDFICETLTLSIEIDSWEFHQDRVSFTKDRRKSRLMQRAGYYHLQFSGPELTMRKGITRALNEIDLFIKERKLAQDVRSARFEHGESG